MSQGSQNASIDRVRKIFPAKKSLSPVEFGVISSIMTLYFVEYVAPGGDLTYSIPEYVGVIAAAVVTAYIFVTMMTAIQNYT